MRLPERRTEDGLTIVLDEVVPSKHAQMVWLSALGPPLTRERAAATAAGPSEAFPSCRCPLLCPLATPHRR